MSRPAIGSIIFWVRSVSNTGKDRVPMYFKGMCRNASEGIVGVDVRGRPVHLGKGEYTATYGGEAFETEDGTPISF